ncbi:MAG: 2-dehydropantoate 2-reductase [Chloroflexota bacterium]
MQVLIYGAGAVGCYLGAHLARAGHGVTLLGREPLKRAVEEQGLTIKGAESSLHVTDIRAVSTLEDALRDGPPYDWIAFTVKAYDTIPAIYDLQAHLPEPPPLACFQNGVGNEESLRAAFGPDRVAAAVTTSHVSVAAPGVISENKARGFTVATDSPAAEPALKALADTSLRVETAARSPDVKWSKLLLNMAGNATAAILDMLPQDIFADPRLFAVEREAQREALAVMRLQGIEVIDLPGMPARLLIYVMQHVPSLLSRPVLRRRLMSGRDNRLPSLLSGLRAGQTRSEAPWLNGAVVEAADRLTRLVPVNHALALTVADICAGRAAWETYRGKPEMLLAAVRAAAERL